MKHNVTILQNNKTLDVLIDAKDSTEAKILTKSQYPKSKVIGVSPLLDNA